MTSNALAPNRLGRLASLPVLAGFASDPIMTLRRLHAERGPYVLLEYPHSHRSRPRFVGFIAESGLYRSVASKLDVWRSVNIGMRAPFSDHPASRLAVSLTRLRGARHAHYRRLLAMPLSKPSVAGMSLDMAAMAKRSVEAWPRDRPMDFVPLASRLMQDFTISLLFGDDHARALPVAAMIGDGVAAAWPFPGPAYFKWLRTAPKLERAILDWAEEKRGDLDPNDIFSVLVNNPDETGAPPSREIIGGILAFTFGAAYDTSQNALAWTLLLLAQHPKVAADLADEIDGALGGGLPSMDKIGALPLLDNVVKEAMRLFPPVPVHCRRSVVDVDLGATRLPAGVRVFISAFLINRDPALYKDPDRFIPERWRDLNPTPFEYPVFGAGGRTCPGALFGNQMVKTALGAILAAHRVELAPGARINHRTAVTLAPHPGVPVVLREKGAPARTMPLSGSVRRLVDLPVAG